MVLVKNSQKIFQMNGHNLSQANVGHVWFSDKISFMTSYFLYSDIKNDLTTNEIRYERSMSHFNLNSLFQSDRIFAISVYDLI